MSTVERGTSAAGKSFEWEIRAISAAIQQRNAESRALFKQPRTNAGPPGHFEAWLLAFRTWTHTMLGYKAACFDVQLQPAFYRLKHVAEYRPQRLTRIPGPGESIAHGTVVLSRDNCAHELVVTLAADGMVRVTQKIQGEPPVTDGYPEVHVEALSAGHAERLVTDFVRRALGLPEGTAEPRRGEVANKIGL